MQGGHEVLKEVDDNGALIVANPQGILGRPWPVLQKYFWWSQVMIVIDACTIKAFSLRFSLSPSLSWCHQLWSQVMPYFGASLTAMLTGLIMIVICLWYRRPPDRALTNLLITTIIFVVDRIIIYYEIVLLTSWQESVHVHKASYGSLAIIPYLKLLNFKMVLPHS